MSTLPKRAEDARYDAAVLADLLTTVGNAIINGAEVCGTGIVLLAKLLQENLDVIEADQRVSRKGGVA